MTMPRSGPGNASAYEVASSVPACQIAVPPITDRQADPEPQAGQPAQSAFVEASPYASAAATANAAKPEAEDASPPRSGPSCG